MLELEKKTKPVGGPSPLTMHSCIVSIFYILVAFNVMCVGLFLIEFTLKK